MEQNLRIQPSNLHRQPGSHKRKHDVILEMTISSVGKEGTGMEWRRCESTDYVRIRAIGNMERSQTLAREGVERA